MMRTMMIRSLVLFTTDSRARSETRLGRRRKKVLRVVRRTLPKVFACPRCGMVTVRITSHDDESHDTVFLVACGNLSCSLRRELRYPTKRADIDVYNTFVDDFARVGA